MKLLHQIGNSTVVLEDVPLPTPRAGEVRIRTAVSALCGSEFKTYRGDGDPYGNAGHEAAGVVDALGDGVEGLEVGQRVGVSAVSGCGVCEHCRAGRFTWCDIPKVSHHMHAEYFVLPAMACTPLPDNVSWETGVLISGDGLGVPYHSSKRFSVPEGGTVAVLGLGPVGLGAVLMQSFLGRRVVGVDRVADRLPYATKMGASDVILAADGVDVPARLREVIGADPDVCIEAAGNEVTVKQCFAAVKKGGTVVFNGEIHKPILAPSEDFIRKDIAAVGTWYFHSREVQEMLQLVRGGLDAERLISHVLPATDAGWAFEKMSHGASAKVLLKWSAYR